MTSDPWDEESNSMSYWRLAEELTLQDAALLILGLDPTRFGGVERKAAQPSGYAALRASLIAAARRGSVVSRIVGYEREVLDPDGKYLGELEIAGSVDPSSSYVDVGSLIAWLKSRGHTTGFFFERGGSIEPYLDPENPRYPQKLAAAVKAWIAAGEAPTSQTPKQQIMKWLRENAVHFGLSGENGKAIESAIEDIATVANWAPKGGAPKTKTEPPPASPKPSPSKPKAEVKKRSFADDLDSDIPF